MSTVASALIPVVLQWCLFHVWFGVGRRKIKLVSDHSSTPKSLFCGFMVAIGEVFLNHAFG